MVDRDSVGLFFLLALFIVVPLTVAGQTQSELPRTGWGQPDIPVSYTHLTLPTKA